MERGEPLVAIGGGALGDAAGFLAATWLRGVPFVQVPTTLVAQVDSSIGGKTGVDLPEGKNLVGAFHQPDTIVSDIGLLRSLPARQLRAALGEIVKMAVLGDERLFGLLESDGPAIARGDMAAFDSGAVAEVVERAAWAKVEVVLADERDEAGAGGSSTWGIRWATPSRRRAVSASCCTARPSPTGCEPRRGLPSRWGGCPRLAPSASRDCSTRLGLATAPLPYSLVAVRDALAADKKHAGGRLQWVLPTADGVVIDGDVPVELVDKVAAGLLAADGVVA